jgi:O-antigen ligase
LTTTTNKLQWGAVLGLAAVSIVSVLAAMHMESYYLALIPFALIIAHVSITDFKSIYFLLLFTLPFSIEYNFTPSLGTDLPDEPLMVGLMLITFVYVLIKPQLLPTGFFANVIAVFLGIHLFSVFVTSITSVNGLVSTKVFLSKIWYVTTFTILTAIVIRTKADLRKLFWFIYLPLTGLIISVIIRHALQGFSFEDINKPMMPFFRNHVNYAAIVTIFLPFVWLARKWYKPGTFTHRLLSFSLLLYVVAIYLSYTRTCYIALLFIAPFVFIVKQKLMKPAFALVLLLATVGGIYLLSDNRYLDFAPDFEETVMHDGFNDHLSSTFEGKDVSSMERVYRWVAILQMAKDKPIMGFGPGNFYPNYMHYTVTSFETYVSDNPERSTAHNYFLLILAEQGIVGLTAFVLFTIVLLVYGEMVYHRIKDQTDKQIVLVLLVVIAMVYVNLLLSDLLESDKVGPFYYIAIGLIISLDIKHRLAKPNAE